jgi:di/tripeptidase
MERMTRVAIPATPRTTFNIGTIEGGISVNTIAPSASMVFEVRSVEEGSLTETFNKMMTVIRNFKMDGISVKTEWAGHRPAGGIPANSPIVEICTQVYRELGFEPSYAGFSTDANLALSLGLSAVCLGISRGANAHRTDEWIEIEPAAAGVEALARITLELVL